MPGAEQEIEAEVERMRKPSPGIASCGWCKNEGHNNLNCPQRKHDQSKTLNDQSKKKGRKDEQYPPDPEPYMPIKPRKTARDIGYGGGRKSTLLPVGAARAHLQYQRAPATVWWGKSGSTRVLAMRRACTLALLATVVSAAVPAELHHNRMGHFNSVQLQQDIKFGVVKGVKLTGMRELVKNHGKCDSCVRAKHKRQSFPRLDPNSVQQQAKRAFQYGQVGALVHLDWIHSPVTDEQGNVGAHIFKDEYSGSSFVYPCSERKSIYRVLRQLNSRLVSLGYHQGIVNIRCDQASEYTSQEFKETCKELDIPGIQYSAVYTPEQVSCLVTNHY